MSKYYEIEQDFKLNDLVWGATKSAPFEKMKVGDSFLVPPNQVPALRSRASRYGRDNRKKFTVRKTDEGYHCLRVK